MTAQTSPSDDELLQAYVGGSQAAFATLVSRYIDAVYSTARRQIRESHLAEDVTQAVFLLLSQKASRLRPGTILPAWLHRATRYCAANALRLHMTHRRHELRATQMSPKQTLEVEQSIDDPQLLTELDNAIGKLSGSDQRAILLHYFQGKTQAEVAGDLGLSTEAVKKRIQRAVVKLQGILARSGRTTTVVALSGTILAGATRPAPAQLAGVIASNIAGKTAALQGSIAIAKAAGNVMFLSTMKTAAAIVLMTLAITAGIAGSLVALAQSTGPSPPAPIAAQTPILAAPPSQVVVTVVDADTGKTISGASIARLIPGVKTNIYSLDSTLNPIGTTDANGRISFVCDPALRSGFLVTASGKAPRGFGFWGCVPRAYQFSLSKSVQNFSGQILDAEGKPVANAGVRVRVEDYFLAQGLSQNTFPILSYPLFARTDSSGHFALPAAEADADGVAVEIAGQWVDVARQGKYFDLEPIDSNLRQGTFVGRPLPAQAPIAYAQPALTPPTPLTLHLRVVDADTNQTINHFRLTPGGSTSPDQYFRTMPESAVDIDKPELT